MKPALHLNLGQHLSLTPQLQQAIRLLQLSTLDLQQEIQNILESNPLLEADSPIEDKDETTPEPSSLQADEYTDFQWSQLYSSHSKQGTTDENDYNMENLYSSTTTLQDHLRWQLNLTPMSDIDRVIGMAIIDAINDDGFLSLSLSELHQSLNSESYPLDKAEIEAVRHTIQHFDPVGCASLNLAECLAVQLAQLSEETPYLDITKKIVRNDIELLGHHNYRQLMKNYQINEKIISQVLSTIHKLHPKPGSLIHQNIAEYVIPDLSVKKINGTWQVLLNQNILPKLSINRQYAALIQRANGSADNQFLKHNLQEARWLMKSIQSRQETLLKVAVCIVEHQKDFLEQGEEAMKPLVLSDVANDLNLHESTISRVTTQKYLHTPRGVFELKYFFSSHLGTVEGGECSSTAIRAMIKKLIAGEDREKPLSDNKIAQTIKAQGIHIARRTVAKYRETMGIAPSYERKLLKE